MRKALALIFAGLALLTAACADDYGRADAIDDLEEGGLSQEEATCVADEMEAQEIDFSDASNADTESDLFEEIVDITVGCKTEASSDTSDEDVPDEDAPETSETTTAGG